MMRKRTAGLLVATTLCLPGIAGCGDELRKPSDPSPRATDQVKIPVPGVPGGAVFADKDKQLEPHEQKDAASTPPKANEIGIHEDSVDETPPGVSTKELEQGEEITERLAEKRLDEPEEPAGAQAYSCPSRLVVNRSSLSGPRVGTAIHFTVSNPGSLDAIRGLFNRPSFGASSNYGFELFNLRCQLWVPENQKAWAQGAANSAYVSIEIISKDRTRAEWLATPAIKYGVLAALVRDIQKRIGSPNKLVDPKGCVFPPGITDHDRLECGNTHWDLGKNFPWDVFIRQVRQGVPSQRVSKRQAVSCRKLEWYRSRVRRDAKTTPQMRRNARLRKKTLRKRGVTCDRRGARKR